MAIVLKNNIYATLATPSKRHVYLVLENGKLLTGRAGQLRAVEVPSGRVDHLKFCRASTEDLVNRWGLQDAGPIDVACKSNAFTGTLKAKGKAIK